MWGNIAFLGGKRSLEQYAVAILFMKPGKGLMASALYLLAMIVTTQVVASYDTVNCYREIADTFAHLARHFHVHCHLKHLIHLLISCVSINSLKNRILFFRRFSQLHEKE